LYCGTLPFGVVKGEDGIPIPDTQEREIQTEGGAVLVRNYDGLKLAFELSSQSKSDREVATRLNICGYRTTGTHGPRPFSKDTVKNILTNRFYIGEIPNGNGGWLKAKHGSFVDINLFEIVQRNRRRASTKHYTVNRDARIYSLGGIARCARCGSNIRMQTNASGKARVYCANRTAGLGCDFQGTFLETYEAQIEWYLSNFFIPEDYQKQILEYQRKLTVTMKIERRCWRQLSCG
jgi:hypothetical protein